MGVGLGGRGNGDHGDLANKGVRGEMAGENHGICSMETDEQTLYRRREDGGTQYVPKVVEPIPWTQSDKEGGITK